MSKIWREIADPDKHEDFMSHGHCNGGIPVKKSKDNLLQNWVYFAEVEGFTFTFVGLGQVLECKRYFEQKIHPSSIRPDIHLEHYWQSWHDRLPKGITKDKRRKKVLKALQNILDKWSDEF